MSVGADHQCVANDKNVCKRLYFFLLLLTAPSMGVATENCLPPFYPL